MKTMETRLPFNTEALNLFIGITCKQLNTALHLYNFNYLFCQSIVNVQEMLVTLILFFCWHYCFLIGSSRTGSRPNGQAKPPTFHKQLEDITVIPYVIKKNKIQWTYSWVHFDRAGIIEFDFYKCSCKKFFIDFDCNLTYLVYFILRNSVQIWDKDFTTDHYLHFKQLNKSSFSDR